MLTRKRVAAGLCVLPAQRRSRCCQEDLPLTVPVPLVFFPLVPSRVDSWPVPDLAGNVEQLGTSWVNDDVFGSVLQCTSGMALADCPDCRKTQCHEHCPLLKHTMS